MTIIEFWVLAVLIVSIVASAVVSVVKPHDAISSQIIFFGGFWILIYFLVGQLVTSFSMNFLITTGIWFWFIFLRTFRENNTYINVADQELWLTYYNYRKLPDHPSENETGPKPRYRHCCQGFRLVEILGEVIDPNLKISLRPQQLPIDGEFETNDDQVLVPENGNFFLTVNPMYVDFFAHLGATEEERWDKVKAKFLPQVKMAFATVIKMFSQEEIFTHQSDILEWIREFYRNHTTQDEKNFGVEIQKIEIGDINRTAEAQKRHENLILTELEKAKAKEIVDDSNGSIDWKTALDIIQIGSGKINKNINKTTTNIEVEEGTLKSLVELVGFIIEKKKGM